MRQLDRQTVAQPISDKEIEGGVTLTFQKGDKVRVGKASGRITARHGEDHWRVSGQQHPVHYDNIRLA